MNQVADISWDDLNSLFSVVMCIDDAMQIAYASTTLRKFMPQAGGSPRLVDVFNSLRPASLVTFEDGLASVGSLCLLTAKSGQFAIRGQLFHTAYQGQQVLCFCGAPWLFWINSRVPDTPLALTDFSAQDVQLDQLFFMSTEKKMVDDLEKLNSDLQDAKQQLEEAQEAQKQFFAQMSHEIRTPLNGVISALSLLDQCPEDSDPSQFVRLARSSSHNLMEVINYVLSVSKLELSPHLDQVIFSWADIIRSTVDVVRAKAHEKSLTINLELSPDLPQACYGNPERFRQTLLNLLINAIKFTDTGGITIRALPVEQSDDHCILRLEVMDSGVGIAPEQLEYIFNPFWSALPEGLEEQEGTGLGLDIVRRNVQSMGGEIQVSSSPGNGAKFWFELPAVVPSHIEQAALVSAVEDGQDIAVLGGRVLLVDDNETNLILGSLILESMGLEVVSVNGGAAAVAAVRGDTFDLVLMDISMPDIDGLEATRQIRTLLGSDQLPIVALTAHEGYAEKKACLDIGMNDYLTKPILRDELSRALANWLAIDNIPAAGNVPEAGADRRTLADRRSPEDRRKPPNPELVDCAVMQDLIQQIGRDNLQIVIKKVQAESIQRWGELEIAEAQGDTAAVRRHVHSLASIFRSVGLLPVGDSLAAIEECLRAGEEPAAGWLEDLVDIRTRSLHALDEQIDTR